MTDSGSTPDEAVPSTPQVPRDQGSRVDALAAWVAQQRGSFTEAALRRSAVAAGYTPEEYAAASSLAEERFADRAALAPIKSNARRWVLAAYGIVWLVYAAVYLGRSYQYGVGPFIQLVLTIALGIGLAISLLVIRLGRPDAERRSRAMALLLAVPVILLVGVAGLCLPFTTIR